ncbi:Ftsk domain-containing protein YdcQ [Frankliniella fusca]|uniref:Ftsk domain-containing protein YdcQ n=1 Tax=Frankliniella fusca TaxID=407009 RepID=A0AAE1H238_9NEOP|nr:Ftsk domain-containing protein YdcQ [Frankliniella fusca]
MEYYAEGSSPAAAIQLHASNVELMEDGREKLGDGHYMPLKQTAYYWHRLFRQLNYGPPTKPFETLKNKIDLYKQNGVTVVVREESPWAILIVTPVMRRTHDLFWSKNIVFVDTSSTCDSTSSNVTLMLTATKAGAIPMAVFLHEGQSTESYATAFDLFQKTYPNGFGGETVRYLF